MPEYAVGQHIFWDDKRWEITFVDDEKQAVGILSGQQARTLTFEFIENHVMNSPGNVMLRQIEGMTKKVVEQFQFGMVRPSAGAMRSIADVLASMPTPSKADELEARKHTLNVEFAEPPGEGFFVFWRKPRPKNSTERLFGFQIVFTSDIDKNNVYECDTIDDAWAFVDYLRDDEAGEPLCIREDACVLYYKGSAGWEALTKDPVPDEYREE